MALGRRGAHEDRHLGQREDPRDEALTTGPVWEPPIAGTDVEHLLGALDRMRMTFRWKAGDLDDAGLDARIASSDLSIRWLLEHLTNVELNLANRIDGLDAPPLAEDDPYARYDAAVAHGRARLAAVLERGGLDQPGSRTWPDGRTPSVRRFVCDLLEEYGRHTGHADLLRESIDGLVGEDPPEDWVPPRWAT